jgi:hypothetical protein
MTSDQYAKQLVSDIVLNNPNSLEIEARLSTLIALAQNEGKMMIVKPVSEIPDSPHHIFDQIAEEKNRIPNPEPQPREYSEQLAKNPYYGIS